MRKIAAATICFVLVTMTSAAFAQENASIGKLGKVNLALKLDYINFTDEYFSDTDDAGLYIGIEGYAAITDNLYLGGEIGRAANVEIFGDDIDFLPVELNAKYVNELGSHFFLDFGGGLSLNRASITVEGDWYDDNGYWTWDNVDLGDEWLFGGQVFTDLIFKIKWFSIGLNGKYKLTADYPDADTNFSNYSLGMTVGFNF